MKSLHPIHNYILNSRIGFLLFIVSLPFANPVIAQELEPLSLTKLPVGMNFFGLDYVFASGNTLMDPTLKPADFSGYTQKTVTDSHSLPLTK